MRGQLLAARGGGGGGGGYSPIFAIRGCAAGWGMVFRHPCLKQGIQFACLCLEQGIYSLDFQPSPLGRVAWARVRQNIKHVLEHGVMFKALYWYLRSNLEQGPKSKRIFLNSVSYFPDYSLKHGQGFTVPAAHPQSITWRVPPPPPPTWACSWSEAWHVWHDSVTKPQPIYCIGQHSPKLLKRNIWVMQWELINTY